MKLIFNKNKKGEISSKIEEKDFSTGDYIQMIKEIKGKKKIEAEFGNNISQEEKDSVQSMLDDINKLVKKDVDKAKDRDDISF